MFSHRTSLILSRLLTEMSDTTPPTKTARLSMTDQGQRRRRRQRKQHIHKDNKIPWEDIHDLVTAAQAMCPPQAPSPVFSWLFLSFFMLILLLPSLSLAFPTLTTGDFSLGKPTMDTTKLKGPRTVPSMSNQDHNRSTPRFQLHYPNTFLCFPYRNTGECLQEVSTYGGCRYWSCRTESTSHGGTTLSNLNTHFLFNL